VLYLPESGCGGIGFETYEETLFGETFLPFRYWCISLAELEAKEYLAKENPVAYGLAPLMQRGEMSKPRLKAACIRGLFKVRLPRFKPHYWFISWKPIFRLRKWRRRNSNR
jgi:hypothetical protein